MTRLAISAAARRRIRQALDDRALIITPTAAAVARVVRPSWPGRPAQHLFVYRLGPDRDLQVIRVLHDAMDLARALAHAR